MTREEAIKYLSDELEKTKAVVALTEREFGVSESVWHTETAAFELAISALREQEALAHNSHDVATGVQSGSCNFCNNQWISVEDRLPEKSGYYLYRAENPHRGLENGVGVSYYQHKA